MVAVIDYDAGNLKSVKKALEFLGQEMEVTRAEKEILLADKVILPGVGSFGDAMEKLNHYNLVQTLKKVTGKGTPFLGICLGMQLLFELSEECKGVEGLSILQGKILKIPPKEGLKIPHMGWNSLKVRDGARLFKGLEKEPYVYFVHSYYLEAKNREEVAAFTEYSTEIHASVERGNIFGCQFHPEKSGDVGLRILRNFLEI